MKILRHPLLFLLCAVLTATAAESEYFGKKATAQAGLIGIIYDFKQNQKRQPTKVTPNDYEGIMAEFLEQDWNESVLNRYFRATRPLYATQIFIPLMDADEAPRAFDLEKVIKPSVWVIHYKGQVSPPEDGVYRFVSYADDFIAVAVNGKTVAIGGRLKHHGLKPKQAAKPIMAANGELAFGDWVTLKKDTPMDLDVLVGERPGSKFCAFLLYEKQGATYPRDPQGQTRYPLFQLAPVAVPTGSPKDEPPFSIAPTVWKAYQ